MTDDLIKRLREAGADGDAIYCWTRCCEAADEIERLREELDEARQTILDHVEIQNALREELTEERDARKCADKAVNQYRDLYKATKKELACSKAREEAYRAEVVALSGELATKDKPKT